jgi:RNA polymerase sigma factor (sigma-70 family)
MVMAGSTPADIAAAQAGDAAALERVIREIQGKVYGLALRMLWHPQDAEDATQEILLRVVTHLSTFRGESRFSTWVYRVAANHLLNWRQSRLEAQELTFEAFGKDLEEGLCDPEELPDAAVLYQEVRVGCTMGMLHCLDRQRRIAYILGEILELDNNEAAEVLAVKAPAYRKRLERARSQIVEFTRAHCGLVQPESACRCSRRLKRAIDLGRVDRDGLLFGGGPDEARQFPKVLVRIRALEEKQRTVALYRAQPAFAVPDFTMAVRKLLASES